MTISTENTTKKMECSLYSHLSKYKPKISVNIPITLQILFQIKHEISSQYLEYIICLDLTCQHTTKYSFKTNKPDETDLKHILKLPRIMSKKIETFCVSHAIKQYYPQGQQKWSKSLWKSQYFMPIYRQFSRQMLRNNLRMLSCNSLSFNCFFCVRQVCL